LLLEVEAVVDLYETLDFAFPPVSPPELFAGAIGDPLLALLEAVWADFESE
jgi:hypothetical protein